MKNSLRVLFSICLSASLGIWWVSAQPDPTAEPAIDRYEDIPFAVPLEWPESQREFFQDGPGFLLSKLQLETLLDEDTIGREEVIVRYLADDPVPETPENELVEGIRLRRALVRQEFDSFLDDRARLLFLHGVPQTRELIDCAETFKPLELWTYPGSRTLALYRDKPSDVYRLWLPVDSKRRLYNPEMEYWLEQWEELRDRIVGGRRFDREICKEAKRVDEVTGVDGLFGFEEDRPKNDELLRFLQPPDDLTAWARAAAKTQIEKREFLEGAEVEIFFPEKQGLRMLTQAVISLPPETPLDPFSERGDGTDSELRLRVEGTLERGGKIFERFRLRFQLPVPEGERTQPVALVVNRRLRPNQEFLMRLRLVEETSERQVLLSRGFLVPRQATPRDLPPVSEEALVSIGEELGKVRIPGYDSLVLIPPTDDVVFGLWRAEALVTGERIEKVAFFLDGEPQMARRRPPFTAELRLDTYPREQIVRADGLDGDGEVVASDEVILNQPRGQLSVRILQPERGKPVEVGPVPVRAEVVVPEEMRVEKVEFAINETVHDTRQKPPWEAVVQMPNTGELTYLTVTAELNDGTRAEAVRFFNSPNYIEEVDVNLVELYTTVTDRSGRLVRGLTAADFQIWEDERPQEVAKFELVEDLPLSLGIAIDVSGSMFESLGEAQRAATEFLENIITPKDRCFALAFADRPSLLMPRTSDVGAVAERLQDLSANGATSLHDAIVTSLYYYRGIRGRRALILLSDGEDTASSLGFAEALEYAKRSGVSIYTIGLRIARTDFGIRNKLNNLAEETGGRVFYIGEANELVGVYDEIESELRSQYLVAYGSDQPGEKGKYREIEIKVRGGKLKARTIRGYYS